MKKNTVAIFVKNTNKSEHDLGLDNKTFSIPYQRIAEAERFVKSEGLDYCFVGKKKSIWTIQSTDRELSPAIKILANGFAPEVCETYLISICKA